MKNCLEDLKSLTGAGDGHGGGGTRPFLYLLTGLAIATQAKLVLEIGTGRLLSTRAFLHGLQITDGRIISCDPARRFKQFSHPRFEFINKPSNEVARNWKAPIDILFIDGDHRYDQVVLDYRNFSPFVVRNGLILLHDTSEPRYDGPYKIIREIRGFPKITLGRFPGLTIIQKTK